MQGGDRKKGEGSRGCSYSHLRSSPSTANALPPPSLSIPDPHLGDEKAARARQRQGSATFISCFSSPSPLLPPPQPRFGGDSPLVTEPIASGRAALRHPHVFVSSSCEAPGSGPEQGLQRSPQQLELKPCTAPLLRAHPRRAGGGTRGRPRSHAPPARIPRSSRRAPILLATAAGEPALPVRRVRRGQPGQRSGAESR